MSQKNYKSDSLRIQVVSDVHAEMNFIDSHSTPIKLPEKRCGVLVMAGDIYVGRREDFAKVVEAVASTFEVVIYIPGNHEFYNGDGMWNISMEAISDHMQRACDKTPNVIMLQNRTVAIGNTLFIGGTAWTNIPAELWGTTDLLSDFITIKTNKAALNSRSMPTIEDFTPQNMNVLHQEFRMWLGEILKGRNPLRGDKTVVVTHHAPSLNYKGGWWRDDAYVPYYFSSDLDMFLTNPVDVWIHGHTHASNDVTTRGGTRIIANPIGYRDEPNPGYKNDMVWTV